jgi:6-phosphogluconolactonase
MASRSLLFVGSLNRPTAPFRAARGKGITAFWFDLDTGAATPAGETTGIDNPNYLAVHPTNGCFYAVSEVSGWNEGTLSAYRFDRAAGRFIYLSKQATLGSHTAHCSLDRSGRFVLIANYAVGPLDDLPGQSIAVFPIRPDGGVAPAVASAAHAGGGPNAARQERPHAHCIVAAPDNRRVVVADLGIDRLVSHRFDDRTGALAGAAATPLTPGSGPRHLVFHPDGRRAFVINELDATISALAYDAAGGGFSLLDTAPSVPERPGPGADCAGIQISPDGRFIYGANRGGLDNIVIYAVDQASGRLSLVGTEPTGGATPRDHVVDPSGRFLLVCNQDADKVTVFRRDPESGRLTDTGRPIETGTPMCAKFAVA